MNLLHSIVNEEMRAIAHVNFFPFERSFFVERWEDINQVRQLLRLRLPTAKESSV